MSIPDPYRQGQPPIGPPGQPSPTAYPQYPQPTAQYPGAMPIPVQPGYPPQNYPQPTYPQPQPTYPQPSYPQPVYPQQNYPQQNYPQQNYAQPAYPQPVYPQPVPVTPASPIPISVQPVQVPITPAAVPVPAMPVPVTSVPKPVAPQPQPVVAQPAAKQPVPVSPAPAKPTAPANASAPTINAATSAGSTAGSNRPLPLSSRPVPIKEGAKSATTIRKPADDEEEDKDKIERKVVKSAPPWLVSLIVHMVALIAMGLVYYALPHADVIMIVSDPPIYAEKLGDQVLESTLQSAESMELDIKDPALSIDSTPVDDPLAAPPVVEVTDLLDANKAVSEMAAPSIGLALTGREKGSKKRLLAGYGGNATTEEAVLRGLQWLKQQQRSDGSWSMNGPYSNGAGVENVCSATSMALLAFQGHGSTHKEGDFKDVVAKGWDAMLKMQNADGDFVRESALHQRLYAQAQATMAVCEIYGMTKDPKFKGPAQKAIDFAHKAQSPEGGWRYEPNIDADVSVTGWYVMALQSAMMAGLEAQSPTLDKISAYLDRCASENGARYAYQPGRSETVVMTAEGLLCRQYLGWKHDDERMRRGVDYLLMNQINYGDENVYYWYYATQVLHHMGGKDWDKWNAIMRQQVPEHQVKTGAEKGSWSPSDDRWGVRAGRLYTTCLSIYMLEVYYRHLPIYKHRLK
jgi:hypothetical protein